MVYIVKYFSVFDEFMSPTMLVHYWTSLIAFIVFNNYSTHATESYYKKQGLYHDILWRILELTYQKKLFCSKVFFSFLYFRTTFLLIGNLVPRVLVLFGQRLVARRDSGELEF